MRTEILESFARHETAQERETPAMRYSELLAHVHARMVAEWGAEPNPHEDARFGASIPDWPAFSDSPAALRYLEQHFKLVILSNVDRASFRGSNARLQVEFDAIFTAEGIGSYKPDVRNFEYLIGGVRKLGHEPSEILHVAESLFHDHAPANRIGLRSAWIHRRAGKAGSGATAPVAERPHFDFHFTSLAELAEAHRRELESRP